MSRLDYLESSRGVSGSVLLPIGEFASMARKRRSLGQSQALKVALARKKRSAANIIDIRSKSGPLIAPDAAALTSYADHELTPLSILEGAGIKVPSGLSPASMIQIGLPSVAVENFLKRVKIGSADLESIIGISEQSMREKVLKRARLEPVISDRAYRLIDAVARAIHAFGSFDGAMNWLNSAVPSLEGERPLVLLRSEPGTRQILSALDRIEFGGVT